MALDAIAETCLGAGLAPPRIELSTSANNGVAEDGATWIERALEVAEARPWTLLWLIGPDEEPVADSLAIVLGLLDVAGAVFGGCALDDGLGATPGLQQVPKIARYTGQGRLALTHGALEWWIGPSHIVTRDAFSLARARMREFGGGVPGYAAALWEAGSSLKIAAPLTRATTGALPGSIVGDGAGLRCHLERSHDLWIPVSAHGRSFEMAYTGRNPAIERVQMRGLFFEAGELDCVRSYLAGRQGGIAVDVGANTGNHAIYLGTLTNLERVVALEPVPATCRWLESVVARNGANRVDLSRLGIAVGGAPGHARADAGRRGHLGSTRLHADGSGSIEVARLDDLGFNNVALLKIDVEGGEIAVIEGAKGLLAENSPLILVEVMDDNLASFLAFMSQLRYRVAQAFAEPGYINLVLEREGSNDRS